MADMSYWERAQQNRVSRRRLLASAGALAAGLGSLSILGCGGGGEGGGGGGGSSGLGAVKPSEGAKGLFDVPQATRGGVFVRSSSGDPTVGWDPHATISFLMGDACDPIHAKLTRHDYRLTPPYFEGNEEAIMGEAAESWETPDPLTYIYHMRPNFKWPDAAPVNGRLVSAKDVEYSFKRALSPGSVVQNYVFDPIDSVTSVDDKTLRITLNRPQWRFALDLDSYNTFILPEGYAEYHKGDIKSSETAFGAGAWTLDEYRPGVLIRYVPNPNYREVFGIPYFDELQHRIFADAAARLEAFRAKQIFEYGIGVGQLEPLRAARPDMKTRLDRMAPTSCTAMFFQMRQAPWTDVRVRRALSVSTDRDALAKTQGFPAKWESGPVTWVNTNWKYDPDTMPADIRQWLQHDPQKARQLLNAAGIAEGAEYLVNYYPYSTSYAPNYQLFSDMWSKAGVKTKVKTWEYNDWIANAYVGDYTDILFGPDNLDRLTQMVYDRLSPGSNRNHSNVNDPNVKKLLDDFGAASDPQKARDIIREIQTISVDQAYAVYMPQAYSPNAWDPRLNNYEGHNGFAYHSGFRAAFLWFSA
jgi:ABC-type transport system substrate-binding protein